MSYRQLKAFHDGALYGGFSRAAEHVSVTQPVLSEHVRRLEQQHDILLFRRDKKRIHLTDKGKALFKLTRRLFELEQQIDSYLLENHSVVEGELRIIVDSACHISHILGQYRNRYPGVFVSMRTSNTGDMQNELRAYHAELAIGGNIEPGSDLQLLELGATPIVAIAATEYFTGNPTALPFETLAAQPIIFREQGSQTRELIEQLAHQRQVQLNAVMEVEGREAMRDIVATGVGIGFVSQAEFGNDSRITQVQIADADLEMRESLCYLSQRAELSIIRSFVEFVSAQSQR